MNHWHALCLTLALALKAFAIAKGHADAADNVVMIVVAGAVGNATVGNRQPNGRAGDRAPPTVNP